MTEVDLSPERDAGDLVDAIWRARWEERRDLAPLIGRLLFHRSSTVRGEALSLLAVTWHAPGVRDLLLTVLGSDEDAGVRSRAAYALATVTDDRTRGEDIRVLRNLVLDGNEDWLVRAGAYEGLSYLHDRSIPNVSDEGDIERALDLNWVRGLAP